MVGEIVFRCCDERGQRSAFEATTFPQCVCTWCVRNFVRCVRHVHEYSYKIQTIDAYNDLSGICPSSISNIIGFNCNPPGVITGARGRRLLMELQVRWR